MKKYKLKQWYPSLGIHAVDGIIIECEEWDNVYVFGELSIPKHEVENNPDFWELIEEKKPLFMTADKVEIFEGDEYIAINYAFSKLDMVAHDQAYSGDVMRFKYESNADTYIWKNKPLFSYEDFMKWGNVPYQRVIMQLAKERAGNEK